jgi:uncharacterized membrane protein
MPEGADSKRRTIGNRIAPPRFLLFAAILAIGCAAAIPALGIRFGVMVAFDAAAIVFLISCLSLFRYESHHMRAAARRNDANRVALLAITGAISLAVLATIASVLIPEGAPQPRGLILVIARHLLAVRQFGLCAPLCASLLHRARREGCGRPGVPGNR